MCDTHMGCSHGGFGGNRGDGLVPPERPRTPPVGVRDERGEGRAWGDEKEFVLGLSLGDCMVLPPPPVVRPPLPPTEGDGRERWRPPRDLPGPLGVPPLAAAAADGGKTLRIATVLPAPAGLPLRWPSIAGRLDPVLLVGRLSEPPPPPGERRKTVVLLPPGERGAPILGERVPPPGDRIPLLVLLLSDAPSPEFRRLRCRMPPPLPPFSLSSLDARAVALTPTGLEMEARPPARPPLLLPPPTRPPLPPCTLR